MNKNSRLPVEPPPLPWNKQQEWAVGGLYQIGYAQDSDLLLVLSSQGRGIFNCLTGEKIARDYDDTQDDFNRVRLIAQGFGPLAEQSIQMAGLFGGGLTHTTEDGWFLAEEAPTWPTRTILLTAPDIDERETRSDAVVVGDSYACELRAFGFSQTGQSFVIATSCDLVVFTRTV